MEYYGTLTEYRVLEDENVERYGKPIQAYHPQQAAEKWVQSIFNEDPTAIRFDRATVVFIYTPETGVKAEFHVRPKVSFEGVWQSAEYPPVRPETQTPFSVGQTVRVKDSGQIGTIREIENADNILVYVGTDRDDESPVIWYDSPSIEVVE